MDGAPVMAAQAQIEAARLLLELDAEEGLPSDDSIVAVAAARPVHEPALASDEGR